MYYPVAFAPAGSGHHSAAFAGIGLLLVMVGIMLVSIRGAISRRWRERPRAGIAFASLFLFFALIWTLITLANIYHRFPAPPPVQQQEAQ